MRRLPETWPGRFLTHILRRFFAHDVGRQGAALAYYLLFTLFPFLIFLSSLLGLLDLDISGIMGSLSPLLPASVLELIETYLTYVARTSSPAMLWFGLVFTIWFPMRAADCLMHAVRRAYRLSRLKYQLAYNFKVLLYTVFLLMTIALSLALATVGGRVLRSVGWLLELPEPFIELWSDLRFLVLGVLVVGAVGALYAMAQDQRRRAGEIVPGVIAALTGWMIISAAYAYYVENFANYSVIYGALGAIIVLMVWLNLTAVVLILGAEINGVLIAMAAEDRSRRRELLSKEKNTAGAAQSAPGKEKTQ